MFGGVSTGLRIEFFGFGALMRGEIKKESDDGGGGGTKSNKGEKE